MRDRLEAGVGQKVAWSASVVASLGLLMWVPFLVVAIRRGGNRYWGAFAAFAAMTAVVSVWAGATSDGPGDAILGAVLIAAVATAVVLVWVWLFDSPAAKADAVNVSQPSGQQFL